MKIVIQRVKCASVQAGECHASIGPGVLVLVGLEKGDTLAECEWATGKLLAMRIFSDNADKMNLSLLDVEGEMLVISQFTLAGSLARGRRPSFDGAMPPGEAKGLFDAFLTLLRGRYPKIESGFFQEHMEVSLVNDGPVTFVLDRGRHEREN